MDVVGSGSSLVDPELWNRKDVRDALAERDISAVYRLLRREGISQRHIAARTGQSQSEVSEILKGRQVMAYDVLVRIADGLEVPRGYLGLAYDEATAVRVATAVDDPQVEEDESVKRRRFLAHAAAVTMGAGSFATNPGSWVAATGQTPAPGRIGMTDVRQMEAATRALRALDYRYGGGFCRDAVVAQLSWGQRMLDASSTELVKDRLYVALADLHNLAGWTSFDTGLIDAARTHFGHALELARSGKNDPLVANILYRMGRVYLHQEAATDALKLFQLGQLAAQESGSELAVAVLCANEAWAYAMLGKAEQAQRQLNRTKHEFSHADHASAESWVRFFDETDLYAMIGTVHTVLAQTVDRKHTRFAIPALSKAIETYGDDMARSKAFSMSALATNHLVEGDVDHGARIGRNAIDLAEHIKSARTRDRMMPLKTEADKRANNGDARDLSELVTRFVAS